MRNRNNISWNTKRGSGLWISLLFSGALFLAGYLGAGVQAGGNKNKEPVNIDLDLYDSITFDIKLSSALAAAVPVVTVKVLAPFTVNNIPERIDKWLESVRQYGGSVELKPDPDYPASRDFGLILELIKKAYDLAKEMLIYNNARNYNVDVLYKPGSGQVTKFVFTLKEGVKQ